MKRLTEEEIQKYLLESNPKTGVDAITREMLEAIDLDTVPVVVEERKCEIRRHRRDVVMSNRWRYYLDPFTPRACTYAFNPSFGGRQVLIGKEKNGDLIFSNGRWFAR